TSSSNLAPHPSSVLYASLFKTLCGMCRNGALPALPVALARLSLVTVKPPYRHYPVHAAQDSPAVPRARAHLLQRGIRLAGFCFHRGRFALHVRYGCLNGIFCVVRECDLGCYWLQPLGRRPLGVVGLSV